jgi:protein SCO1/2
LALNEAADGKVGGFVDSAMLFCFKYDSHQSKYGLQVFQLMKLGGALTVIALALWLGTAMIQAKRENT